MRDDPRNPASGIEQQDEQKTGVGVKSMGNILALPDRERRIINWLIRHKQSTLLEVAEHQGEDEPTVKSQLDELVKQGYVQENAVADELRYSVKLAAKRGSELF